MKTQKCCAHCPGKLITSESESHACCQPRYVSGNLRISSLNKNVSDDSRERDVKEDLPEPLPENRLACYDQFAIAKKLHAENLEHQPLPDRVDDSVFKNVKPQERSDAIPSKEYCEHEVKDRSTSLGKRYGPILGCKEPKTKMDLAICWETPLNPVYEPFRPTHIDGSEGGLAPAIFTLVQHGSSSRLVHSGTSRNNKSCKCCPCHCKLQKDSNSRNENNKSTKCCCDCLCKDLNKMKVSKKVQVEERPTAGHFRKCVVCKSQTRNTREDPRLIKSAVGLALGTEKPGRAHQKTESKATISKPKSPFTGKSFCIDTLTPPFSVVNGCREADFPEHWRLMSVYQQSYRNPYRRRVYRC
ncbi:hypothetical protein K0M31_013611 [Melipona bicolor]|uniref:DUF4812 domain-containing protein n=1 Tax=Melipona bicolor TaxID=60889 RepID=A0AA40FHJ0_9HYME|nr:hypothetical protein K0M31_013611 [Melipona bicolor]